MNAILRLFKPKERIVNVIITGGSDCPNCHEGGLFHYTKSMGFPEDFYLCEECLSKFDENKQLIPR